MGMARPVVLDGKEWSVQLYLPERVMHITRIEPQSPIRVVPITPKKKTRKRK